jgi:hypothetical protein
MFNKNYTINFYKQNKIYIIKLSIKKKINKIKTKIIFRF